MKIVRTDIESASPISFSKRLQEPEKPRELPRDYEERCWRERMYYDAEGYVQIPPMMFVKALQGGAKFLSQTIVGKGKQTYTKHFLSGVQCNEMTTLPIKKDEVKGDWIFVPSNGVAGGGKRVDKCFPRIDEWKTSITFYILDDLITKSIFQETLNTAGLQVGIGRFRPANGGYYGRFTAKIVSWKDNL